MSAARSAKLAGNRSLGGVLIRFRAVRTAPATATARASAAVVSSSDLSTSRSNLATGSLPAPLVLYVVNAYAPSRLPSVAAARSSRDSVLATRPVPASARAAAPEARRTCSASAPAGASACARPSPTPTSSGAPTAPRVGNLTTSSALPEAPARVSSSSSVPSYAASTSSAPPASTGPSSPVRSPTISASASAVAADPVTRLNSGVLTGLLVDCGSAGGGSDAAGSARSGGSTPVRNANDTGVRPNGRYPMRG